MSEKTYYRAMLALLAILVVLVALTSSGCHLEQGIVRTPCACP